MALQAGGDEESTSNGQPNRLDKVPNSLGAQLKRYFAAEASIRHADILLLLCCIISGLVDSTVYNAYGTFVSMQTGNTIFVGLGAAGQPASKPYGWARSLTSIACFVLGSLSFSRLCRVLGPLRRRTLMLSFLLQSAFIFTVAAIAQAGYVDGRVQVAGDPIHWLEEIPVAFLSFQSAGQIVASRNLGLSEVPTVVITSVLCDFASDPQILSPVAGNAKRNRRLLAFVAILVGAIAGGWISKTTGGLQSALWIAGAIKMVVTVSWMLWPEKRSATQVELGLVQI